MNCLNYFPKSAFSASSLADKHCTKILLVCKIWLFHIWSPLLDPRRKEHWSLRRAAIDKCLLRFLTGNKKRERPEKENTHSSESSFLQLLWSQMLTSQNFRPPPPRPQPSSLSCCGLSSRNRSFFGFRLDEIVKNKLCKLSDSQFSHSQEGSGGEGLAYPPPQHPQPHNLLFKSKFF